MEPARRPGFWGGRAHVRYTVVVFVLLASLDNAAGALYPALLRVMADDLGTTEGRLGLVTAGMILVTAVTAVGWGYLGDRTNRKSLLFWGTLLWAAGLILTTTAATFAGVAGWSMLTGIGLGSIASVGFSVISDFVSPRRRGLAMSFWGLSQGAGGIVGLGFGGLLGATEWRRPFVALAVIGTIVAFAYLSTYNAPRGRSEPALDALFASGASYEHTISRHDLPILIRKPTNRWLILQGFSAQIAYGSLIWVPLLYQAKVQAEGYDLAIATAVGTLFGVIFQLGGITSIASGWLGDRLQRRSEKARAIISATGILAAIPFFVVFFFIPLTGLDIPPDGGTGAVVAATFASVFTNPFVAASFLVSVVALTFTSADSPNWFALITDVNLPEHRGTIFGLGNLVNGVGRSMGNGLTGFAADRLASAFASPTNYSVGLAVFQIFFLPTGYCYWRASKTCGPDIAEVRQILAERAASQE
jgi:MFS family permease